MPLDVGQGHGDDAVRLQQGRKLLRGVAFGHGLQQCQVRGDVTEVADRLGQLVGVPRPRGFRGQ